MTKELYPLHITAFAMQTEDDSILIAKIANSIKPSQRVWTAEQHQQQMDEMVNRMKAELKRLDVQFTTWTTTEITTRENRENFNRKVTPNV